MEDRQLLVKECGELRDGGVGREELVSYLRNQGCFKIDSIAILREALGIGLGEAKELVHCSATWRDVREADDDFHDRLIDTVTR